MTDSTPISKILSKAIGKMIKPLVKLLMQQGVTYIGLQSLLKESFVEVADKEKQFQLDSKRQTDSRISLLTGVHRKEVKRLREKIGTPQSEKEIKASVSAQMMAMWSGHPDYVNAEGLPIPLHRQHETELSFNNLVFAISKDKHPRSILDDWLNQGLVEIDSDGKIHLSQSGYIPQEDMEEKLFFAGKNISEHLNTVTHNLSSNVTPRYDRAVYYHRLSKESARAIELFANAERQAVLQKINLKAAQLQQQDNDNNGQPNPYSIHLGAYFSHNVEEEE
jgi:hypothetical protein